MNNIVIFTKKDVINKIANYLNINESNVKLSVMEKTIKGEEPILIDVIEVSYECLTEELANLINNLTVFYKCRNNKFIIELIDLRDYISDIIDEEVIGTYRFSDLKINGKKQECILFDINKM